MATIFAHALVPLAARAISGNQAISQRLLWLAIIATMVPDADVISFQIGIAYSDILGHRGFTHSILFAACVAGLAAQFAPSLKSTAKTVFALVFIAVLSHPFLDAFTNGGLGVALLWPVTDARFFMPWQPIEVSPIGIRGFLTGRGLDVLVSEFFWVLLPLVTVTGAAKLFFKERNKG